MPTNVPPGAAPAPQEPTYPWDIVRAECWSQVRTIFREEGPQGEMHTFYRSAPVDNARKLDDEQIQVLRDEKAQLTADLTAVRAQLAQEHQDLLDWEAKVCALETELAEVRARLALPAWHPIETAPTDGTAVILWSPAELEAVHAWWLPGDGRAYTPCWAAFGSRLVVNPTHWMPLPAPPSGDIPTFITREGHDGTATAPDESDPH